MCSCAAPPEYPSPAIIVGLFLEQSELASDTRAGGKMLTGKASKNIN